MPAVPCGSPSSLYFAAAYRHPKHRHCNDGKRPTGAFNHAASFSLALQQRRPKGIAMKRLFLMTISYFAFVCDGAISVHFIKKTMVRFFCLCGSPGRRPKAVRIDGHKHVGHFDVLQRYAPAVHQAGAHRHGSGEVAQHEQVHNLETLSGLFF